MTMVASFAFGLLLIALCIMFPALIQYMRRTSYLCGMREAFVPLVPDSEENGLPSQRPPAHSVIRC